MWLEGEVHNLGPRDSVLIPPGAKRSPYSPGKAPGYMYVIFNNRRLMLEALTGRKTHLPRELNADLNGLVSELSGSPGSNTDDLTNALIVRILIGLRRAAARKGRRRGIRPVLNENYQQELVGRAEAFMRRNLHRRLSREDIAEAVHLSEPHMARVFKAATGKTMVERLSEIRVAQAKRLLLESSISITQIATDIGFGSFSHFSKLFKESVGTPPSDYRRAKGRIWQKRKPRSNG
jgi:AraC-like DNA-binding protein